MPLFFIWRQFLVFVAAITNLLSGQIMSSTVNLYGWVWGQWSFWKPPPFCDQDKNPKAFARETNQQSWFLVIDNSHVADVMHSDSP